MKRNPLVLALVPLLGLGLALTACGDGPASQAPAQASQAQPPADAAEPPVSATGATAAAGEDAAEAAAAAAAVEAQPRLEYAEVVRSVPVTEKRQRYATVTGTEAIRETTTSTTPREVCEDVVVQERLPERDGNTGGTVAGAVIGGLLGNQVGSGSGRKAATVAGAVAGGVIGNKVDKKYERGQVVERVEQQCHTVQDTSESSQVVGYRVNFRNPDGSTGSMRMDKKPGDRIALGSETVTVGYDVTYRYDDAEHTVRMDKAPGERLPVIDGQVVTRTAAAGADPQG